MKVAIVCRPGLRSFIDGIIEVLQAAGHETVEAVEKDGRIVRDVLDTADVVWCEWANEHAVLTATNTDTPCVVRMHRYEAHTPNVQRMPWTKVAALVSTSEHVLDRAIAKVPALRGLVDCHVIPSGAWFDRFESTEKDEAAMRRIGVCSYIHGRKQPGLWLQTLAALPDEYALHVAGREQEPGWVDYLRVTAGRMGVADRVHFDGWQTDVGAWWADKGHCLSAAMDEGCPYNVIEAVACGALPVVHEYVGARSQWPFSTWVEVDQAAHLIVTANDCRDGETVRAWARDRYDLAVQAPRIVEVVEGAARPAAVAT